MTEQTPDQPDELFHRDPHVHGGLPEQYLDDDKLARLAEEERVAAGVDDYDPDEIPPATDAPVTADITESEEYQEERAEIRREEEEGELRPVDKRHPFPPTRYDRS